MDYIQLCSSIEVYLNVIGYATFGIYTSNVNYVVPMTITKCMGNNVTKYELFTKRVISAMAVPTASRTRVGTLTDYRRTAPSRGMYWQTVNPRGEPLIRPVNNHLTSVLLTLR